MRVAEGERNYHSFYHLVAGAPSDVTSKLGLGGGAKSFHYLNQSSISELSMMPGQRPPAAAVPHVSAAIHATAMHACLRGAPFGSRHHASDPSWSVYTSSAHPSRIQLT